MITDKVHDDKYSHTSRDGAKLSDLFLLFQIKNM